MKRATISLLGAVAALSLLGGCESTPKSDTASAAPVNTVCPVGGEKANSTVTTAYSGKTVAFCCENCKGKWDGMTAEKKSAALAAVTK